MHCAEKLELKILDSSKLMFSFIEGGQYSDKCFKFAQNEWKEFANLKQKRSNAAGIVFEDHFHIFGGYGGGGLKSTEIISANGVVIDGPNMKTELYYHAITNLNHTSSIISGGSTKSGSYTSKTWFYNHKTKEFSAGPALLQARRSHASATLVDKHGIYIKTVRP